MIFDIILVAFIALFALKGKKKGLIGSAFNIASVIIAYCISGILSKPLAQHFSKTPMYNSTVKKMCESALGGLQLQEQDFLSSFLSEKGELLIDKATMFFTETLMSVLLFIVAVIVLKAVSKLLSSVFKLPGLNFLNSVSGAVLGMLEGFLFTYIILAIWSVTVMFETPEVIGNTTLLKSMFENNLLFLFFT